MAGNRRNSLLSAVILWSAKFGASGRSGRRAFGGSVAVSVVTNTILHLRAIENQMTTVKRAMRYSHAFSSPAIIEGALASRDEATAIWGSM